jgi:hypothetical protein
MENGDGFRHGRSVARSCHGDLHSAETADYRSKGNGPSDPRVRHVTALLSFFSVAINPAPGW